MSTIKLIFQIIQAQVMNLTILHPTIMAAIAGIIVYKLTKKIIHIVFTIIAIIVLYEIFVAVTGFGLPENLFVMPIS